MDPRLTRKQIVLIVALVVVVAAIVVVGLLGKRGGPVAEFLGLSPRGEEAAGGPGENGAGGRYGYSPTVPEDATPTTPVIEAPAAPNREERFGIFEMRITRRGFDPETLTVKAGNISQVKVTAVDGDYDFSVPDVGLYVFVKQGETQNVSFGQTTTGTFTFECRDHCPRTGKIQGSLIVMP